MNGRQNTKKLHKLTSRLIHDALSKIRQERQNSLISMEERFKTAEYFLLEAKEYVDGSWEMLEYNKPNASLALSRWVLEAFMNLQWVVNDKGKIKPRLRDLAGEALRCEANLFEDLANLCPSHATDYDNRAKNAIKARKSLGVKKIKSLGERIKSIKHEDKPNWPNPYALYRICCAAAHPNLKIWERFENVGSVTILREPFDNKKTACFMAVASILYLVGGAYCLTKLGNVQHLKNWWKNEVGPLLE